MISDLVDFKNIHKSLTANYVILCNIHKSLTANYVILCNANAAFS